MTWSVPSSSSAFRHRLMSCKDGIKIRSCLEASLWAPGAALRGARSPNATQHGKRRLSPAEHPRVSQPGKADAVAEDTTSRDLPGQANALGHSPGYQPSGQT